MHVAAQVPALVRQIQSNGALPLARDAQRAAIAVLRVLVRQLPPGAATEPMNALLEALVLTHTSDAAAHTPESAVMRELGVASDRATAITRAVVVAVIETLGEHAPTLFAALPDALRPVPVVASAKGLPTTAGTRGSTLAEGRPGSRHPVARARPRRAHSESVAAADDPHADSRLATTEGLSPERDGHSLATVRSASERTLAGASIPAVARDRPRPR